MPTYNTKRLVSDQVLFRIEGGWPDAASAVQKQDIWKALEQKVNGIFKLQQAAINLPSGETIPDGLAVATYEDIAVSRYGDRFSKSTLPIMPISLPKNAGIQMILPVLNITPTGDRIHGAPLIPLVQGQRELLQTDRLLNDLLGRWGYTPNGMTVYYTKDLTTFGVTLVDMKLIVFDIATLSETDILPIPQDMMEQIITELVQMFAPVQPETGIVNKNTTIQNTGK